ncbi:tight adherence protein B [Arthrobacter sp. UYNi723]
MTLLMAVVLVLAVVLLFSPPGGATGRFRRAVGSAGPGFASRVHGGAGGTRTGGSWRKLFRAGPERNDLSLTLVVQQLAALLKGGRTPARLWDELWLVHGGRREPVSATTGAGSRASQDLGGRAEPIRGSAAGRSGPSLSAGSLVMLGAVRAAAFRGAPVSEAIRKAAQSEFSRADSRELRIWCELAACFDIAEASGCPLADVLARFAAQLEVEDDAEAARQTALAGPKATVGLLTWLPLMGLGLGIALGVDPLAILIGTPLGLAALAAGVGLTITGRIWSARLVGAAAGAGVP